MPAVYRLRMMYRGKVVTSDRDRPEHVTVRQWRAARHDSQRTMAVYWHKNYLPLHFTPQARLRYQGVYKKRSPKYLKRKQRDRKVESGAQNSFLVFSGNLKRVTKSVTFRSFPSRFRVSMRGTRYTFRRPPANQPDIHAEITAHNPSELRKMRTIGQRRLADVLHKKNS